MLPETTKLPDYLPYNTSRSCQIIEPQLNRGSIRSPDQRSFVSIYFKKSTRYHVSNLISVIARVLPKRSPGNSRPPFPGFSAFLSYKPSSPFSKTLCRTLVQRKWICLTAFILLIVNSKSLIVNPSSILALIIPTIKWAKNLFEPRFECFFYEGKLFEPRFECPFYERKPIRTSFPRGHCSRQAFAAPYSPFLHSSSPSSLRVIRVIRELRLFTIHYSLFTILHSPSPMIHSPLTDLRLLTFDHSDHLDYLDH